jgi:anti-sigma regulatory factor (Ser/Thr protein kinase)
VTVRGWASEGYVVVTVDDCGPGIHDPLAGLVAPHREMGAGGLGLWITHQLCRDVSLINTADGFRVRLVTGGLGEMQRSR